MSGFESDLRLVREARSRTLEQIQQETRIPIHVLKRFEDGDLVDDPTYGQVYLVALLRSYARAVGLPQADVLAGYERVRAGVYHGELSPSYDGPALAELPPPVSAQPAADPAGEPVPARTQRTPVPVSTPTPTPVRSAQSPMPASSAPASSTPASSAPANPVEALRSAPAPPTSSAPPPMRVARPSVPGARRSYDKNWSGILALFAVVVVAIGAAVYFLFLRPDAPADDALTTADGVAAQVDSAAVGAGAAGGRAFQTPISVVVTAGSDGLQSFRVTADGSRAPHWIDVGTSQTFTADSALVFDGETPSFLFSDATLDLQGVRWTPADGRAVVISQATGQRLLDSLAAAPAPAAAP